MKRNRALVEAVSRAEIKGKERHFLNIAKAGEKGIWTASAWILERRYPEEFGRHRLHRGTGPDGAIPILTLEDAMLRGATLRTRSTGNGNGARSPLRDVPAPSPGSGNGAGLLPEIPTAVDDDEDPDATPPSDMSGNGFGIS